MIRVNLIGDEALSHRRAARIAGSLGLRTIQAGILLATVAVIGWWTWSLRERSMRLDLEIASAEAGADSAGDAGDIQRLELRRTELQQKVAGIERLGTRQTLIQVLEDLDTTVPANVWLLELSQKNADLTLKGLAATLADVSRFVANLHDSGLFGGAVEIVDTETTSHSSGRELVRFSVKGTVGN